MTDKSRGAGRPATLNRRRLRRRLSAAVLLLIGLAVAGGLAVTLTPTHEVAVAYESQSAARKPSIFDESQIDALGAYVQANGGGPTVPRDPDGKVAQESLMGSDIARGGDLFRLN